MQTIRVAAVSMNGGLGRSDLSLDKIAGWCQRAKADGAQLVLFPELVVHGHCTTNTSDLAEPVPNGPSVQRLEQLSREMGLVLSVGLSERDEAVVYNTQVLIGPSGFVGKQRKIHMSRDEVLHYQGGRDLPVCDIGACRVGTVICYDNVFPEVSRILALRGADVILAPHAARTIMWNDDPESESAAREYSYRLHQQLGLRARENVCFYVVADQVGRAGYVDIYPKDDRNQPHHPGGAFIIGPDGQFLVKSQRKKIREEMVVATLEADDLTEARSGLNNALRDRRIELFNDLLLEKETL